MKGLIKSLLVETLASMMTALRVTPPTGGNMQREHTDRPSSKRREGGKNKNKMH